MGRLSLKHSDTPAALDILRAVAAQAVCIGHAMSFFSVGETVRPPNFPSIQNVGVLLFFVLSGFLITSTLFQNSARPDYGFRQYFLDRFARIYSGLLPALAFVVVVDWLVADPDIARYRTPQTLLANLAMMENYRGFVGTDWLWSTFGSASPLWTLAIEWHIYMFVGASFFIAKRRGAWLLLVPVAAFFGQVPLHYLFGALQPDGVGSGLFSLWLGGAAVYFVLLWRMPLPLVSFAALGASVAAYAFLLSPGHEYRMITYPALVVAVGSLIALTQRTNVLACMRRPVEVFAGYSFTLYLIHHTVMLSVASIFHGTGWGWFWGTVIASNAIAYLIAQPFEMQHKRFAAWLHSH